MEKVAEKTETTEMTAEEIAAEKREHTSTINFKMVSFSLSGKDYAIDIMKVKEIAKAGRFTYVPNTSPFVLGVYNLRGDIIPIIDLRLFFNIEIPERKSDTLENMIIVSVEEQTFGIVVDGIDKVVGINSSVIQPPHPLFGDINIKYIYGVVESNNRLYILLDVDRIFGNKIVTKAEISTDTKLSVTPIDTPNEKPSVKVTVQNKAAKEDVDYSFVVDSLKTLKKFYVTSVNEQWVRQRYIEWAKERGTDNTQLANEDDADKFLKPFYSDCTETFWSKQYAEMVYKCLPENNAKQINVWNPGCGKGIESYSIACLLKKRYPDARIRIFAHDINLLNVSNAPLLTIPPEFSNSWYAPFINDTVAGAKTFRQNIKDMILFEYHDCTNITAMPDVDIIMCRDLVSFLAPDLQKSLFEDFAEKMKGNAVLFIGSNETLEGDKSWAKKSNGSVSIYTKK